MKDAKEHIDAALEIIYDMFGKEPKSRSTQVLIQHLLTARKLLL